MPILTADDFEMNMREMLEEVRKHIPKLFVNLVLLENLLKYLLTMGCIKIEFPFMHIIIIHVQVYKLSLHV